MKKIYMILLIGSFFHACASVVEQSYCIIFGSTDASDQYQKIIRQALHYLDVPNAQTVPIKQMNCLAPTIFGSSLYSFTAQGIWINESILDQCTSAERIFALYHEASHYAFRHHRSLIFRCLPMPFLLAGLVKASTHCSSSLLKQIGISSLLGFASAYAFNKIIVQPVVFDQEQEADLLAAKILRDQGKNKIVDDYVSQLLNLVQNGLGNASDGWHPTYAEQASYLAQVQLSVRPEPDEGSGLLRS